MRRFFWRLFLCLDLILIVIFTVGYLAPYLHPGRYWWGGIVAIAQPLWTLALIVLALVPLLARRWKWLGLHVVLVLLMVPRFISLGRSAPVSNNDLVVMTMNVPRLPETEIAAQAMTQLALDYDPHLIGIQESVTWTRVDRPFRLRGHVKLRTLIDSLHYKAEKPSYRASGDAPWLLWHQPVLMQAEILAQEQLVFRQTNEDPDPLFVVRTHFRWQNREAVHYNVHLRTFGADKPWYQEEIRLLDMAFWRPYIRMARDSFKARAWQVEQLRTRIDREQQPVLISGDFNSTPNSWTYRQLSSGFQDVFRKAGTGWGATYPFSWPLIRIDFILCSSEWEVVTAMVPSSHHELSDHLPVVARVRWRE